MAPFRTAPFTRCIPLGPSVTFHPAALLQLRAGLFGKFSHLLRALPHRVLGLLACLDSKFSELLHTFLEVADCLLHKLSLHIGEPARQMRELSDAVGPKLKPRTI